MEIHIFIFTARKPGTTPEFFRNYMETKHVPLIQDLSGSHFPIAHTRNYIPRPDTHDSSAGVVVLPTGLATEIAFDAVTEMVYQDEAHFAAHMERMNKPEHVAAREEDEAEFLDRGATQFVRVGEVCRTGSQKVRTGK